MAEVKVLDNKEVWWATTKEWNEISGWEETDTDDGVMKIVFEAWENGELE